MQHLTPEQAVQLMRQQPDAMLIDCRSETEFHFVGHPLDAYHVAWSDGPDWALNPHFIDEVKQLAGGTQDRPLLVICRSGTRSIKAAEALEAAGFSQVVNVLEGFEGQLDENNHRGLISGWRHDGLPWEQS